MERRLAPLFCALPLRARHPLGDRGEGWRAMVLGLA